MALKEQRVIVVQDITYSPVFKQPKGLEVLLDAGVRAVKSAPLIGSHGEILGILSVHYRKPHNHIDAEILRFQTLAAAVAAAIDHARKPEFAHGL